MDLLLWGILPRLLHLRRLILTSEAAQGPSGC
jgi:hypothetical protein